MLVQCSDTRPAQMQLVLPGNLADFPFDLLQVGKYGC